jgi:DNA-binding MarR family transcriptional regulator
MPAAPLVHTALRAERPAERDEHYELVTHADELLSVMASIRRSGRLLAKSPVELSTLTSSQLDLIRVVLRRPGVSVTNAAEELRLAPNTVSTLVRQLTDEHLLTRRIDAQDRRVARLDLTPAMRRKVSAFQDRRVAMLVSAMEQMTASDRRRLADSVAVLEELAGRFQEQESAGV